MEPARNALRDLARRAFEMRPDKDAERVTAFVYWWDDSDIIFFDLKRTTGHIVHTSEFTAGPIIVTVHLLKA